MDILIESPKKQGMSYSQYFVFMLAKIDVRRSRKYLVFIFCVSMAADLLHLAKGRQDRLPIPISSLMGASGFFLVYVLFHFFWRRQFWKSDILFTKDEIQFMQSGLKIKLFNVCAFNPRDERILEVSFDEPASKHRNRVVDIVFESKTLRDTAVKQLRALVGSL